MKFQKGLLSDLVPEAPFSKDEPPKSAPQVENKERPPHARIGSQLSDKDHLFETLEEETGSEKNYLKLLGIVVAGVVGIGAVIFYLTLPGIGDEIRAPAGLELALRDHFLTVQKRTATDITFYQCDGYYSARVGVETRTDIPNPVFRIGTYSATTAESDGKWEITAVPLNSPAGFIPCQGR